MGAPAAPSTTAQPVSYPITTTSTTPSEQLSHAGASWKPSYARPAPVLGLACLFGVVICTAVAAAVLVASDHVSSSQWHQNIAPNVCLSLINSVSNILLAVAVGYGVAIAWWRKAMRGATVEELHKSWEASSSAWRVFGKIWSLDAVALAALAAKVAVADGVLFQRATCDYVHADPARNVSAMGLAATAWPTTGFVVSDASSFGGQAGCGCFMIGDQYSGVVNSWEISNGFFRGYNDWFRVEGNRDQHCDGTCYTSIDAIGVEIDCNDDVAQEDIAEAPIAAWNAAHGNGNGNGTSGDDASAWTGIPIFNSSFSLVYGDATTANYTYLILDLLRFTSNDPYNPSSQTCAGNVYRTTCKLRPALISYPIEVMNYSSVHIINGVSLDVRRADDVNPMIAANTASDEDGVFKITGIAPPAYNGTLKQAAGYTVQRYVDVHDQHVIGGPSALGGLASAIDHFLSSTATLTYHGEGDDGVPAWSLEQDGTLAQRMMYGPPNMGSCDCSFLPAALDAIVQGINQLTFLTAVGMAQQDDFEDRVVTPGFDVSTWEVERNGTMAFRQLDEMVQVTDKVHYMTNYEYMIAGIVTTLAAVLLVIPAYWKYGELGREVTLGPIEVASAFQAPLLTQGRRYAAEEKGNVDDLIKDVGRRKVMYGFVDEHVPSAVGGAVQRTSVYMAAPDKVRRVSGVYSPPTSPLTSPREMRTRGILEGDEEK